MRGGEGVGRGNLTWLGSESGLDREAGDSGLIEGGQIHTDLGLFISMDYG